MMTPAASVALCIIVVVVVAFFAYLSYAYHKESKYIFFFKDTWLKLKKVVADFDGPEYMRLERDVTGDSDRYWAICSSFEPDGKVKERKMWRLDVISRYENASTEMSEKLEQAYQKRTKEAEEASVAGKKAMQASALKAFLKK